MFRRSVIDQYVDEFYDFIETITVTEEGKVDISFNDEKQIKNILSDFLGEVYDIIRGDFDDWLSELIDQKVERP